MQLTDLDQFSGNIPSSWETKNLLLCLVLHIVVFLLVPELRPKTTGRKTTTHPTERKKEQRVFERELSTQAQ
jgi:hypothetical protein